jgi:hypothetical protein
MLLKANSHIACRAHAVPLRVLNVSFPFDLHSAAVSDSDKKKLSVFGVEFQCS